MDSQKKFLPKLYPQSKEKSKTWFVGYTGKDGLQKKVYGKLNHLETIPERLKEAERLISDILAADLMQPAHGIGNQLIKDLQAVYDIRKPAWSSKSQSAFQTHFYEFAKWYRSEGCPAMDVYQAMKFLNTLTEKGRNSTTRNNYRDKLKSLFGSLKKYYKARYQDNPFAEVDLLAENQKTKEWFRPHQVEQLYEAFAEKDRSLLLAVRIMANCFARPNEIRQLRVCNIIWDTKKLRIESKIGKTSFTRHIPIPDNLFSDLLWYKKFPADFYLFSRNGKPVSRDNLSKRHKEVLQELQYPKGFTFYGWKNTGAVKMLCQDKKNIRYISKCMGHHSLDMTDRYFQSLGVDETDEVINFPDL